MSKALSSRDDARGKTNCVSDEVVAEDPPSGDDEVPRTLSVETARTQWQFGDWDALVQLDCPELEDHPDRAKLALLCAAGHQQIGHLQDTRRLVSRALEWGADRRVVAEVLVAGVHNTIGRALALGGNENRALDHFWESIETGTPGAEARLLAGARVATQFRQLGFSAGGRFSARISDDTSDSRGMSVVDGPGVGQGGVRGVGQRRPVAPSLENSRDLSVSMRLGDLAMKRLDWVDAISRWQDIISVMGDRIPDYVYRRLSSAYEQQHGFPPAAEEEEVRRGAKDKYSLLAEIHDQLQPSFYLEIGVQKGTSLGLAACKSVGVDPMPQLKTTLPATAELVVQTSDEFFRQTAPKMLSESPDLVMIDGMHLFEYALRDFINVEKYAKPWTLVLIDDVFPCHPVQAARRRRTRTWTGDVWKLYEALQEHRPELYYLPLDVSPTGVLLIAVLDAGNATLEGEYERLRARYSVDMDPTDEYLERSRTHSPDEPILKAILDHLRTLRGKPFSPSELVEALNECE